ncbi:MAG: anthranilate synthase component I [Actinomycetota bacterium]
MAPSEHSEYKVTKSEFESLARNFSVVPIWREVAADLETPVSAYMKLGRSTVKGVKASFLLESVEQGERWGRYSFIGLDPFLVMTSRGGETRLSGEVSADIQSKNPLEAVREVLASLTAPVLEGLPPLFVGTVGYLGYDVVNYLENLPQTTTADLDPPEMMLMFPRSVLAFDHLRQRITVVANVVGGETYEAAVERTDDLVSKLGEPLPYHPLDLTPVDPEIPPSTMTRQEYMSAVEAAKEHMLAGDIFQVVVAHRFSTPLNNDPFEMYRMLRLVNPSPYMFYLSHPEITVLGSSPEPLIKVHDRRVIQRPIAGTRPRGRTDEEDLEIEKEFVDDEKERAEHVMLVDLARNDIGRVSDFGSVEVEELMQVERYSHVMHMVSQVAGHLADGKTALDALYASFPAGTVSGAPKIRAMEIIDELEPTRRGPYAGVVGYFDLSGNLDTCIALRTAYILDGMCHIQVGAGIVADSDPATEWEETLNKARAVLTAAAMAERREKDFV